ncbi:hypothetical protein HQ560_00605 [bacterium]|nr:hypothetical protein [bacterium]
MNSGHQEHGPLVAIVTQLIGSRPVPENVVDWSAVEGTREEPSLRGLEWAVWNQELQSLGVPYAEEAIDNYMFLTTEAYLYLLPVMIVAVLEHDRDMIRDMEWLIYALGGVNPVAPDVRESATLREKKIVCAFLHAVHDGNEFGVQNKHDRANIQKALPNWE